MSSTGIRSHETITVELPQWVIKDAIACAEVVENDDETPIPLRDSAKATRNVLEGRLNESDADTEQ